MSPSPVILVVLSLAAWRTWVLLSRDSILDRVRNQIAPEGSGLRDFLECPYCAGFWCAGFWLTLWDDTRYRLPGIVQWQLGWWACAALVVIIEIAVDRLSGE